MKLWSASYSRVRGACAAKRSVVPVRLSRRDVGGDPPFPCWARRRRERIAPPRRRSCSSRRRGRRSRVSESRGVLRSAASSRSSSAPSGVLDRRLERPRIVIGFLRARRKLRPERVKRVRSLRGERSTFAWPESRAEIEPGRRAAVVGIASKPGRVDRGNESTPLVPGATSSCPAGARIDRRARSGASRRPGRCASSPSARQHGPKRQRSNAPRHGFSRLESRAASSSGRFRSACREQPIRAPGG